MSGSVHLPKFRLFTAMAAFPLKADMASLDEYTPDSKAAVGSAIARRGPRGRNAFPACLGLSLPERLRVKRLHKVLGRPINHRLRRL
jgi:hypothetical protein